MAKSRTGQRTAIRPDIRAWAGAERAQVIIDAHCNMAGPLLPLLHAVQEAFGHIPTEIEPRIAEALNLSRAEVYGVISFYHDFRREPAGRHVLKLCRAEACQSMGSEQLADGLLRRLGVAWGGRTADGALSVEPAYCLGLCACAPAAMFDGEPLGRVDAAGLHALVADAQA